MSLYELCLPAVDLYHGAVLPGHEPKASHPVVEPPQICGVGGIALLPRHFTGGDAGRNVGKPRKTPHAVGSLRSTTGSPPRLGKTHYTKFGPVFQDRFVGLLCPLRCVDAQHLLVNKLKFSIRAIRTPMDGAWTPS